MIKKITLIFLILFIAVLFHTAHISHSRNEFYDIRPYFYSNMFDYVQMTDFLMAHPEISGWAISGSQIQWKETLDGEVPQEITPIVKKLSSTGGIGSVQINLDRTSVLFRGFHNEGRSYIYYSKLPVEDINPEAFEGTLYQRLTDNWYYFGSYSYGVEHQLPNPTLYNKPFEYQDLRPIFKEYVADYENIRRFMEEEKACMRIEKGNGLHFYGVFLTEDGEREKLELNETYFPNIKKSFQTLFIYGDIDSVYRESCPADEYNIFTDFDTIRFTSNSKQSIIYSMNSKEAELQAKYHEKLDNNWFYSYDGDDLIVKSSSQ